MWVEHRSVVIVPPEGGLEFRWDSEMCWCFIHITIELVLGTTRRSVIESCITRFLLPTRNSSTWDLFPRGFGSKEEDATSVSLGLSLRLPFFFYSICVLIFFLTHYRKTLFFVFTLTTFVAGFLFVFWVQIFSILTFLTCKLQNHTFFCQSSLDGGVLNQLALYLSVDLGDPLFNVRFHWRQCLYFLQWYYLSFFGISRDWFFVSLSYRCFWMTINCNAHTKTEKIWLRERGARVRGKRTESNTRDVKREIDRLQQS